MLKQADARKLTDDQLLHQMALCRIEMQDARTDDNHKAEPMRGSGLCRSKSLRVSVPERTCSS